MAESRISTLGTLLKPKVVRVGLALFGLLAAYDTLSSQLELPTARRWWGMSGSLLPWWGWLLILQAIFVYALFEYVRRGGQAAARSERPADSEELKVLTQQVGEIAKVSKGIMETQTKVNETQGKRLSAVEKVVGELPSRERVSHDIGSFLGPELKEINDRFSKFERLFESQRERIDGRLSNIDLGFRAILNREWHQRLFRELGEDFETLAQPIDDGQGLPDAKVWQQAAKRWRGKLDQWLVIADYYAVGTAEAVLSQPEHLYDGEWTFDESVLTANQVHRYKELAIWWHNARESKARVDRCLEQTAFLSPSMKGRLDSPPNSQLWEDV